MLPVAKVTKVTLDRSKIFSTAWICLAWMRVLLLPTAWPPLPTRSHKALNDNDTATESKRCLTVGCASNKHQNWKKTTALSLKPLASKVNPRVAGKKSLMHFDAV